MAIRKCRERKTKKLQKTEKSTKENVEKCVMATEKVKDIKSFWIP